MQKVDPLWIKITERIPHSFVLFLTLLILTAGGRDPGLGQEELPAGADAHLEEALGIPGNVSFAQRQSLHAHRLGVQHQLLHSHKHAETFSRKQPENSALLYSHMLMSVAVVSTVMSKDGKEKEEWRTAG